jgi:Cdc6-like AAA superfamily ATPase
MQRDVDPRVIEHNRLSFSSYEAQQIRDTLRRDRDPSLPAF